MATFFELLNTADFQRATAQTRVRQEAGQLAVQPAPALGSLVRQGATNLAAGQQLATDRRRTDLVQDRIRFQRRQDPFAVGIGALDLGANVLGGLGAAKLQRTRDAAALRSEQRSAQGLDLQRQTTRQLIDISRNRRNQLEGVGRPQPVNPSLPQLQQIDI